MSVYTTRKRFVKPCQSLERGDQNEGSLLLLYRPREYERYKQHIEKQRQLIPEMMRLKRAKLEIWAC